MTTPNETPTPRTEKEKYWCHETFWDHSKSDATQQHGHQNSECVSIDFARTLERELAEAKNELNHATEVLTLELQKAEAALAEANAKLADMLMKQEMIDHYFPTALKISQGVKAEIDQWREVAGELAEVLDSHWGKPYLETKERDEIRAALEKFNKLNK